MNSKEIEAKDSESLLSNYKNKTPKQLDDNYT
jgi:hypothetical protein